jgi:hypothetical protein
LVVAVNIFMGMVTGLHFKKLFQMGLMVASRIRRVGSWKARPAPPVMHAGNEIYFIIGMSGPGSKK